jgi:hypothetical protein
MQAFPESSGYPPLDNLEMAHLGSPKALLGKGGHGMLGEFRDFAMRGSMQATVLGLADDYAKVMGGGQGSDTSRNQILDFLAAAQSKGQMSATLAGMRAAVTSQIAGRLGNNSMMRKMYGANVPPTPQQGETPVNDKTGRVIG